MLTFVVGNISFESASIMFSGDEVFKLWVEIAVLIKCSAEHPGSHRYRHGQQGPFKGLNLSEYLSNIKRSVHTFQTPHHVNWFMHPVARVSINMYRNLRTQQMLVPIGAETCREKCTLNCAPTFVAYGGFYTY
jgi:hypothetical protein